MSILKAAEGCISTAGVHKTLNAFIKFTDHGLIRATAASADSRSNAESQVLPLNGRLIAVKDNICTSELPTTCGSKSLIGFQSPYEATVVEKLADAGAIIAGKTNLDEFGMGSHSTNSAFGPVRSGKNGQLSAGGSSGGSAVAVATGQCWASIGTDTGGSIRLPAAYTGIFGFKPSYGIISRNGVVPYANSLDTVGILGNELTDIKQVFNVLRGYDAKDPTSLSTNLRLKIATIAKEQARKSKFRIGVPLEYNTQELHPLIRTKWEQALVRLSQKGHEIVPVSLPATKLALPAYYVLAPAEASSNLAKYDGVRYGQPAATERSTGNVLFASTRGEKLGEEVRRRILLGSFTLSASAIDNYFIQAQRVRRLIQQDFDAVFATKNLLHDRPGQREAGVNLLLTPTAPTPPPRLEDLAQRTSLDSYRDDVLTVPASLAGLPALSIPTRHNTTFENNQSGSVGLQLIGQFGDDDLVLHAAESLASSVQDR